jgi:hypothetical protein
MTDADHVYRALQALVAVASDAWDNGAYDNDSNNAYMLYAEITNWADEVIIRMRHEGYVNREAE